MIATVFLLLSKQTKKPNYFIWIVFLIGPPSATTPPVYKSEYMSPVMPSR